MALAAQPNVQTRGRPRLRRDEDILRAALHAFADHGYEGMSLRALNAELGLSRGTINQRFASKEQLWYAAVDYGFQQLLVDVAAELQRQRDPRDDLTLLRENIRAFLIASSRRPELVKLMNHEGLHSTERLDHIVTTFVLPALSASVDIIDRLSEAGVVRRIPIRTLLFLVAHGAASPFTLKPLSDRFDPLDGRLDVNTHIEQVTDVIVAGLRSPTEPGTGRQPKRRR